MALKALIAVILIAGMPVVSGCRMVRLIGLYKKTKQQVVRSTYRDSLEIPFRYSSDWIVLPVTVRQGGNAFHGEFVFDSGASSMLFDSCQPIRIWVPHGVAKLPTQGALGVSSEELKIADEVLLSLGAFEVFKPKLPVAKRPRFFPKECRGIIGAELFRNLVLTIDFRRQKLVLRRAPVLDGAGVFSARMKTVANNNPVVLAVAVGDLPNMNYYIDAGHTGPILLQKSDESSLRKLMGAGVLEYAWTSGRARDGSGKILSSNYYTKSVNAFNGSPTTAFEVAGLVNSDVNEKVGNIGLGFMKQVFEAVTLDFPGKRLYYRINEPVAISEKMDREVYFKQEDTSIVTGPVLIRSAWYEQGLRPGLRVTRINNYSPLIYMNQRKAGLQPGLRSITFITQQGGAHTITK